jgi:PKD repeat protein
MKNYLAILFILIAQYSFGISDALKIKVTKGTLTDETVVRFLPTATPLYDSGFDAYKLFSSNTQVPSLFTRIDAQTHLSINAQPTFSSLATIDLHLKVAATGTYTFQSIVLGAFAPGTTINLKDKTTGTVYSFSNGASVSITVQANTLATSNLFEVIVSAPITFATTNATCKGINNGSVKFSKGTSSWGYVITNSNGVVVDSLSHLTAVATVGGLSAGMYSVAISSVNAPIESYEFTISNEAAVTANFVVEEDSVLAGDVVNIQNLSTSGADYTWAFGNGQTSTQGDPSVYYTEKGIYEVTLVVDSAGCVATHKDSVVIYENLVTGTTEIEYSSDFSVRQENGGLLIRPGATTSGTMNVYSISGQLVKSQQVQAQTNYFIEIPKAGLYVVELHTEEGSKKVTKVFVQ